MISQDPTPNQAECDRWLAEITTLIDEAKAKLDLIKRPKPTFEVYFVPIPDGRPICAWSLVDSWHWTIVLNSNLPQEEQDRHLAEFKAKYID